MSDPKCTVPGMNAVSLTSPSAGKTMTALVRPWWRSYQEGVRAIEEQLSDETAASVLAALGSGPETDASSAVHRVARLISAVVVIARRFHILNEAPTLDDVLQAMTGACHNLSQCPLSVDSLERLASSTASIDFLPYMLDLHGEGTRKSVIKDESNQAHRRARKAKGVFLTPGDVASFMVSTALDGYAAGSLPTVLDPACGTGVFLRTAFRETLRRGHRADEVARAMYGMDISPEAVDACRVVLMGEMLLAGSNEPLSDLWSLAVEQVTVGDSLLLASCPTDSECRRSWPAKFGVVVANPPYAKMGQTHEVSSLASAFRSLEHATNGTNIYLPFLELMWLLTEDAGSACMVVPLSLAYSTTRPMKDLRSAIQRVHGTWWFTFFDRTPDAIFGDDVKQRIAIVSLRRGGPTKLRGGAVQRWTSRSRAELFDRLPSVRLEFDITEGIPRLGSDSSASAYIQLGRLSRFHFEELTRAGLDSLCDIGPAELLVSGTAYNWLSVYRRPNWIGEIDAMTASPYMRLKFRSSVEADAAYALLCSKMVYWLWRVDGDCFHVPAAFIRRLPGLAVLSASDVDTLAECGRQLWAGVLEMPIHSVNGGRRSVTYSPWTEWQLVGAIDRLLLNAFGLPELLHDELEDLVKSNVIVDPSDRSRTGRKSRVKEWKTA